MWSRILFIGLMVAPSYLNGQHLSVNLSPKHAQKLNTFQSGHKRLLKYYKFYKQDSSRSYKKLEKHYKKILDSAIHAETKQVRLAHRLTRKGIVLPKELTQADSVTGEIKRWYAVLKDSTSSDSLKQVAKVKVKELALNRARQYPGVQHLMDKYHVNGDLPDWKSLCNQVPGLDTLTGLFESKPEDLLARAEGIASKEFSQMSGLDGMGKEFADVEKLKALPDQYRQQYEQYTDKEHWKQEGKEKAVQEATDYFADHADKLLAAQQKLSKLLSKYRDFTNSNDLSNAVKRTSMQGQTFWEHLVVGGNYNVVSTSPFSIDISPQLGYKFTTRFFVGIGANYRHTFGDSIKYSWYISPVNSSIKVFSNYDVIKNFYTYAEWEQAAVILKKDDLTKREWKSNFFVGAGKKFLIHPKLYLTVTALYNLDAEEKNPAYPHRFQIRTGFQLSELALRKKRVYYDPNR